MIRDKLNNKLNLMLWLGCEQSIADYLLELATLPQQVTVYTMSYMDSTFRHV
jgi:hypothetical protein